MECLLLLRSDELDNFILLVPECFEIDIFESIHACTSYLPIQFPNGARLLYIHLTPKKYTKYAIFAPLNPFICLSFVNNCRLNAKLSTKDKPDEFRANYGGQTPIDSRATSEYEMFVVDCHLDTNNTYETNIFLITRDNKSLIADRR